jgi:hypothetical protein
MVPLYTARLTAHLTDTQQRGVYLTDSSNKFWATVDKELEEIRKECAQPERINFTQYAVHSVPGTKSLTQ